MPSMLYAVQDNQGREVISAHVDVEKVSDVSAYHEVGHDKVSLLFDDDVVIDSGTTSAAAGTLTLCRWPSDDKLAEPVKHKVISE